MALAPNVALADPLPAPSYRQSVQQTYDIIQFASSQDTAPAQSALKVLIAGTGQTQPEIINDLEIRPPDYEDARARLLALVDALGRPADTVDPQLAQERLHQVMSMKRYDALHRPQSVWDRFVQWVNDRINDVLELLFGHRAGAPGPNWVFSAIGILILLAAAVVVFRAARGRLSEGMRASPPGPRAPSDYFAEADRLAAHGDRVGGIRALCAGVAATLAGERTWEGSPLTVREIFMRSPDPASLLPLLTPFEAAVYGGRPVDEAAYDRAALAAGPYRRPVEEAA